MELHTFQLFEACLLCARWPAGCLAVGVLYVFLQRWHREVLTLFLGIGTFFLHRGWSVLLRHSTQRLLWNWACSRIDGCGLFEQLVLLAGLVSQRQHWLPRLVLSLFFFFVSCERLLQLQNVLADLSDGVFRSSEAASEVQVNIGVWLDQLFFHFNSVRLFVIFKCRCYMSIYQSSLRNLFSLIAWRVIRSSSILINTFRILTYLTSSL